MKIHITQEKQRFKEHIDVPDNTNILFSGIFGIGKTFFLRQFFEENLSDFETVWLSPVHYGIATNEDIINCIKYDLAFELLSKEQYFQKEFFPKDLTARFYLKDNFLQTVALLAENAGSVGKSISGTITNLKKIKAEVEKFHEEIQLEEEKEIMDFLERVTVQTGSIYEENRITELIRNVLSRINYEDKKTVLIIDDLDRLDPEHIFRILNVFACHMDFSNVDTNKFGFQKVILVCDIDNIRNAFTHRFGTEVDFNGYMDKFYSQEIFKLNNKMPLIKFIGDFVDSLEINGSTDGYEIIKKGSPLRNLLTSLLRYLVEFDILSTRTLLKMYRAKFSTINYSMNLVDTGSLLTSQFDILQVFEVLIRIFGSEKNLLEALKKLDKLHDRILFKDIERNNGHALLSFLDVQNYFKITTTNNLFEFHYGELIIRYSKPKDIDGNPFRIEIKQCESIGKHKVNFPYSELVLACFNKYRSLPKEVLK